MAKRLTILLILLVVSSSLCATNEINWFDRPFTFVYSKELDQSGDIATYLSLAYPALFVGIAQKSELVEIALSYAAVTLLSYALPSLLKEVIDRPRPYTYHNTSLGVGDNSSFPSRHTTAAFASAAFTHTLFAQKYPTHPLRKAVTTVGWTIALSTAILRIASGNHFVSDVVAGAVMGAGIGIGVPYLAQKIFKSSKNREIEVALAFPTIALSYRY